MIAPSTNFDMTIPTKSPAIVKKPVSFFNTPAKQEQQPTQPQTQQPTPQQQIQQPTQPPKQQPTQPQPTQQQPAKVDNTTTELEEMHIGLNEFMEGAPKAKKRSEKQLLHLAKMRQQKALKREKRNQHKHKRHYHPHHNRVVICLSFINMTSLQCSNSTLNSTITRRNQ
jgi:hypothetical protein